MDINRSASSLPPSNPGVESPSTSVTCVPGWNISRCAGGRDHTALSSSLDFAARASRSDTVVLDSMLSMRSSARFSVQSMRLSPFPLLGLSLLFLSLSDLTTPPNLPFLPTLFVFPSSLAMPPIVRFAGFARPGLHRRLGLIGLREPLAQAHPPMPRIPRAWCRHSSGEGSCHLRNRRCRRD